MSETADDIARKSAEALWEEDRASRGLGMQLVDVASGRATMTMKVSEAMANAHGLCHGGLIFTLADSAFGYACNSYGQPTLAQHCSVTFITPGRLGDELTANAIERSRTGRSGIYDVTVTRQDGTVIAEFRGHSRSAKITHDRSA